MAVYKLDTLMLEARRLAAEYRKATGKSLGISSEIAKFDVARLMDLELKTQPQPGGYDAIGKGERAGKLIQIKGRAQFDETKSGQRIGQMKIDQEWNSVMLVIMDDRYEPMEIYEAERKDILDATKDLAENKRKKRGAMSLAKFKIVGRLVWTHEEGVIREEVWSNQPEL